MADEEIGVAVFRAPDREGGGRLDRAALRRCPDVADEVPRLRARKLAMRTFFLEPHDALMDACSVVENIKELLARVGEVAVDVGRRYDIARLLGEERYPFIEPPKIGRAASKERGCQSVSVSGVAVS